MERAYWLAWSQIYGIGSVLLKRIHQEFGELSMAWSATAAELQSVEGLGTQIIERIVQSRKEINPLALLTHHEEKNSTFWTPADAKYPRLLWEIPDPPAILYHAGHLQTWTERNTVAIVGTRSPSVYGRRWAYKIGKALAEHGFTVVSGLAEGVDAEAHKGCLEGKGNAIAVIGTGVDRIYPIKNQFLYQQLLQSGLVVSEYPNGTPPDRSHFPQRNRIIAGLSRATIVIEAPVKSGALITAHQANEYGRDVFALPGSLEVPQALGCLHLINKGAQVILGIEEMIAALGTMPNLDRSVGSQLPEMPPVQMSLLDPLQQKILNVIGFGEPMTLDRIVAQVNLPTGEVSGSLLQLELLGAIAQCPGMRYQRLS